MRDDEVADFASRAGNEVDDARRHADLVQQVDEPRRDDGGVARGLEHDGVPADDRRRRHAHHDGARKVPRRYHGADAERNVDELVPFARHRDDRLRLRVTQRLTRVEFEKVDRLGDVAVGLGPALAHLVDQQRVVFEATFAQQRRRLEYVLGPFGQRQPAPGLERARGRADGLLRLFLRGGARDADHLRRVRGIERPDRLLGLDLASVDHQGIVPAQPLANRVERGLHGRGVARVLEILDGLVLKGGDLAGRLHCCRRHAAILPALVRCACSR